MVMSFFNHLKFQYIFITHVPSRHHRDTKMNRTESHRENFQKNRCKYYLCGIYTRTFLFDTCLWHMTDSIALPEPYSIYKASSPLKKLKGIIGPFIIIVYILYYSRMFYPYCLSPLCLLYHIPCISATFQIIGMPLSWNCSSLVCFHNTTLSWCLFYPSFSNDSSVSFIASSVSSHILTPSSLWLPPLDFLPQNSDQSHETPQC